MQTGRSGTPSRTSSRDAIQAELESGGVAAFEVPYAEDIIARIDEALGPYFD